MAQLNKVQKKNDRLSGATRDTARISARLVYQLYHSEAL